MTEDWLAAMLTHAYCHTQDTHPMNTISDFKPPHLRGYDKILASAFSPAKPDEAKITDLLRLSFRDRIGMDEKLRKHMGKWKLKPTQKRKFARLFGWDDFASFGPNKRKPIYSENAANNTAWFTHMVFLIQEFHRLSSARPIQFYTLTLADVTWNFGDKYSIIDWYRIKKKATRALETIDVEGVAVLEFQAMTNEYQRDEGRLMMPNVYAIIWRKDGLAFDDLKAQKRLCKSFTAKGAAKGAVIKPVTEPAGGLIGVLLYLTKPISTGKRIIIRPGGTSRNVPSAKHYRNNQSLRIMEVLSLFKHSNLIFGRGEGTKVRQAALKAAGKQQPKDWVEVENVPDLWKSARQTAGKADFMPVRILWKA
jgi:hypothetical protein